jgi:hypothetical protein
VFVRQYTASDLEKLRRMHGRQGFEYEFPDVSDPIFVSKLVLEEEPGNVVMASLARLTCEMYLLMDRDSGCPEDRYRRIVALHQFGAQDLARSGLDDAHAWLPPPIARRFGQRLERLGWVRDDQWTPYCYRIDQNKF